MVERTRRKGTVITQERQEYCPDKIDYSKLPVFFVGSEKSSPSVEFNQGAYTDAKELYRRIYKQVGAEAVPVLESVSGIVGARAMVEHQHNHLQWEMMRVTTARATSAPSRYAIQSTSANAEYPIESLAVEFDSDPLQDDSFPSLTTCRASWRRTLLGQRLGWQLGQLTWHDRLREPENEQAPDTELSFIYSSRTQSEKHYELKVYYPTKPGTLLYGGGYRSDYSDCRASLAIHENGRVQGVEPVAVAFYNPGYVCLGYQGGTQQFGFAVESIQYRALAALQSVTNLIRK